MSGYYPFRRKRRTFSWYEVVSASEASNVFEFGADFKKCLQSVALAAKEVDGDTKKAILKMIRSLFEILLENLKISENFNKVVDRRGKSR